MQTPTTSLSKQREIRKICHSLLHEKPTNLYGKLLLNEKVVPQKQSKEIYPVQLLDAPNVTPEPSYQLLDWSTKEVVCLGLKSNIFLRNFKTGVTQVLAQLEQGIFTSIKIQDELVAYTTSNGQLIIMDSELKQALQLYQIQDIVRMSLFQESSLYCACVNKGILYFDLRQNKYAYHVGDMSDVYTICKQDFSFAAGSTQKVDLWDIRKPTIRIAQYNQTAEALTWHNEKRNHLCAGGQDCCITIWSTQNDSNSQIKTENPINQIITSENHIIYSSGNVAYCDDYLMNKHSDRILRVAVSPDQKQICSLGEDELLIFWNINNQ